MKLQRLALPLLPLFFVFVVSCQQATDTTTAPVDSTPSAADSTSGAPVPAAPGAGAGRFKQAVRGAWINAAYLATVANTRSPRQALAALKGPAITMLVVPASPRTGDTLDITLGYNNHEGGSARLILDARTAASSAGRLDFGESDSPASTLRIQVAGPDTLLVLPTPAQAGQRGTTTRFRKAAPLRPASDELEANMVYTLRHLLFRGNYRGTDSTGRPLRVQFTADGTVRGLGNHSTYTPQFDFTGPYTNLDYLMLNSGTPRRQDLLYSFRADTLRLYRAQQDTVALELKRGPLLYTLTPAK